VLLGGVVGVLMAWPGHVAALGVTAPQTRSALGQTLELVFPINLGPNESLSAECVHADVMAGDAHIPPSLVTLRLEGTTESNVHAVRLQSVTQINEPIVTVTLSLGCPARMTRQYAALIDPPSSASMAEASPLPDMPAGQEVSSQRYSPALRAALSASESKPELLLAQPPAPAAASAPTPAAPVAKTQAGSTVVAQSSAPAQSAAAAPRKAHKRSKTPHEPRPATLADAHPAQPPKHKEVSRLQLDAPEAVEAGPARPAAAASAPASAAVASAELPVPASAPASDATQDRLAALEDRLNQMQRQNQEQQGKLLQMQAKLDAAQSERYQNPLVWALGLMVLGLGGLSAYLWHSRKASREGWWSGNEQPVESRRPAPPPPAARAETSPGGLTDFMNPSSVQLAARAAEDMTAPLPLLAESMSTLGDLTAPMPMNPEYASAHVQVARPAAAGGAAPVTVEELIDMQQQVEFFLVLGQTAAAIDLLQSRIDTGASSALPYLKLMEIYQKQGDSQAFTDLGERFARRFSAVPPAWGGDMNEGRALDAYKGIMTGVQNVWRDAAVSMALLQSLLTHGGQEGDETQGFDLPAYRDLLLLYSVARDLSEHDVRGEEIDVFLPLDGRSSGAATGMMATMAWEHPGREAASPAHADVDISLDDAAPADEDEGGGAKGFPPDAL
jgi:hypothetical protein